jgi:regulator of nucleoside diphosphate kinase
MSAATPPPNTISSLDLARLERLLEMPAYRDQDTALKLGDELVRANVVAPAEIPANVVTMNSTVTCVEEISGAEHQFTLVYPNAADAAAGRISVLAPIGTALLGLSIGQSIDWIAPDGRPLRVRVASISYQPEAAGDLTR